MVQHLKISLRKKMLAKRDSLSKAEVTDMSEAITEKLLSHPRFMEAKVIGFYLPKGNEVDTRHMIEDALRAGKKVAVPVTGTTLAFCNFSSFKNLQKGKYDILEPKTKTPIEPDLIIVPGVAFGLCMHRLGYGKGYYDSYLAHSSAYRIGICYDFQVVEKLPTHENDQRMDEIVTEKRVITL
jgi:5-formyltetrahydrofolate cyclo-ligase